MDCGSNEQLDTVFYLLSYCSQKHCEFAGCSRCSAMCMGTSESPGRRGRCVESVADVARAALSRLLAAQTMNSMGRGDAGRLFQGVKPKLDLKVQLDHLRLGREGLQAEERVCA